MLALLTALPLHAQTITTRTRDFGSGPNGQTGQYTSQAIVAGNPAIAYYNVTESSLMFARNSAPDGSGTWTITTLDFAGTVGQYCSLAVVNGNPAISYYDGTNFDLKYVRATDASGTSWATPVTPDSTGNVGQYTSLAVVNGSPAISYYDSTNGNLKGATYVVPPPDIAVSQAATLTDGVGRVTFGTVVLGGSNAPLTFTITNPGAADLTGLAVTGGTAEWVVSALSSTTVTPGGPGVTFTVTFAPTSSGSKTADLDITSNVRDQEPLRHPAHGHGPLLHPGWGWGRDDGRRRVPARRTGL